MKVLIFGPSGSGKTYVAKALQRAGINAFDDADIEGLSNWYDRNGKKITEPTTADEALENHYSFLWSKKFLAGFLAQHTDVYVFGGSGNIAGVFNLFDKVYFLKIGPELQKKRLLSPDRPTPNMDVNEDGFVIWGDWFEQLAKEQNIPFINADQTPEEIYKIISSQI
jgi:shikimate kinase